MSSFKQFGHCKLSPVSNSNEGRELFTDFGIQQIETVCNSSLLIMGENRFSGRKTDSSRLCKLRKRTLHQCSKIERIGNQQFDGKNRHTSLYQQIGDVRKVCSVAIC